MYIYMDSAAITVRIDAARCGKGSSCLLRKHVYYFYTIFQVKHMLGTTSESANTIEENTHIAYLCDLLERIWGHGLKKREVGIIIYIHVYTHMHTADFSALCFIEVNVL